MKYNSIKFKITLEYRWECHLYHQSWADLSAPAAKLGETSAPLTGMVEVEAPV